MFLKISVKAVPYSNNMTIKGALAGSKFTTWNIKAATMSY